MPRHLVPVYVTRALFKFEMMHVLLFMRAALFKVMQRAWGSVLRLI